MNRGACEWCELGGTLMFGRLKSQNGFSVLENILSTVILGVGLMGGMLSMQNATINTMSADMSSLATNLANEKVEMILADNQFKGFDTILDENYDTEILSGNFAGFTRQVSIIEVDSDDLETPTANSGLKRVDVIVSWGGSSVHNIKVSTLLAHKNDD